MINSLSEIQSDTSVPRNVRTKMDFVISTLKENAELPVKVNKILSELDAISNDTNIESYTRTQIWNIMSLLEKL